MADDDHGGAVIAIPNRNPASRRVGGFTLIELLIAVAASGLLLAGIVIASTADRREGRLDEAVERARGIALVADLMQSGVEDSVEDNPLTYARTYTYAAPFGAWQDASVALAASGTPFDANSPYGTPYQVLANGAPAQVRFVIPEDDLDGLTVAGSDLFTEAVGADLRVTVQINRRPLHTRIGFVQGFRRSVLEEELR